MSLYCIPLTVKGLDDAWEHRFLTICTLYQSVFVFSCTPTETIQAQCFYNLNRSTCYASKEPLSQQPQVQIMHASHNLSWPQLNILSGEHIVFMVTTMCSSRWVVRVLVVFTVR